MKITTVYDDSSKVKFAFNRYFVVPKLNSENGPAVQRVIDVIEKTATQMGAFRTDANNITPVTLVIAIGGDGTMLEAMRIAAKNDAVAIGINLGRVGFLTEIANQQHLAHALAAAFSLRTDTFVEERTLLTTSTDPAVPVCNEVSVSQLYADSLITYRLWIGDMDAGVHRANGILVSTPTGSTAYTLSVGGALMMPGMEAIQVAPVAPSTMTSRPIIVPASTHVRLQVWGGHITVRADGQVIGSCEGDCAINATKTNPYEVSINAYERKAKILHFSGWNFFDVLTEKLGWKHE